MKLAKLGAIVAASVTMAQAQAAQHSNIVGYNTVACPTNTDRVVSSPFDYANGVKTLNQMFPPALSNTAFIASLGTSSGSRRTQVLVPDFNGAGINKSPTTTYFFFNGAWRKVGDVTGDYGTSNLCGATQYVVVRNPAAVTTPTTFISSGTVEEGRLAISIPTAGVQNDLYISAARAVGGVTLDELVLGGSGVFSNSLGTSSGSRRDQLLFFAPNSTGLNQSPVQTFFYFNGAWRVVGNTAVDSGSSSVVDSSSGFIYRRTASNPAGTWTEPAVVY